MKLSTALARREAAIARLQQPCWSATRLLREARPGMCAAPVLAAEEKFASALRIIFHAAESSMAKCGGSSARGNHRLSIALS